MYKRTQDEEYFETRKANIFIQQTVLSVKTKKYLNIFFPARLIFFLSKEVPILNIVLHAN